ncbi:MAG: MBOAT family O-acyltransferase [Planctomycetota bacterium JB042]
MLFNSSIFLLFIAVVLPLYGLARGSGAKKALLVVASYVFYANWDVRYLGLLWLSTAVDFYAARSIAGTEDPGGRRRWLLVSLVTNLGVLGIFKYGNFVLGNFEPIFSALAWEPPRLPADIPVGISFYTFQTLSYTIDVYRRRTEPVESLRDFALFVAFFPQLVAGPIVRATQFFHQVREMKPLAADRFASGFQRFVLGLFKKVVVADNLSLYVDTIFAAPDEFSALALWCGAFGFALQVYLDFSGYADMAIGLARVFGVELPENFDAPYLARSVTDFWRRWHMTMGAWLRDFVYIAAGGSRHGEVRTSFNLFLTMFVSGIWHGAAWTFIVWGMFHGVILAVERALGVGRKGRAPPAAGVAFGQWAFTFTLVSFALVMFRSEDFASMEVYVRRMFSAFEWLDNGESLGLRWVGVVFAWLGLQWVERRARLRERVWDRWPGIAQGLVLAAMLVLVTVFFVDEIQFVYFEF